MSDVNEPAPKRVKLEVAGDPEIQDDIDFTEDTIEEDKFICDDKYKNFVTPEELQRLSEFKVLDEVKSNEEDSDDADSVSSDGKSQGVPEDELEKMLDEDLPHEFKVPHVPKEKTYVRRTKVVLEEKGVNLFEILPLDWMMVRHYSGMPIYMHRGTRVCTLSKPYFLGNGNTRRHDIPISAIPCLAYRRALEEEKKQEQIDRRIEEQIRGSTGPQPGPDDKEGGGFEDGGEGPSTLCDSESDLLGSDVKVNGEDNLERLQKTVTKCPATHTAQINTTSEGKECLGTLDKKDIKVCPFARSNNIEQSSPDFTGADDGAEAFLESNGLAASETDEDMKSESVEGGGDEGDEGGEGGGGGEGGVPLGERAVRLPGGAVMAPPRVESARTSWKSQLLGPEQINDYCKKLFIFKSVNIMHFKRWADRRKYIKARKTLQCPTLPEGTRLITIPAQSGGQENGGRTNKRDWVMNMNGRSYLSVFHEYVRRALQQQPQYKFKQLENAATPYEATVFIGEMQYGVGHGSSKRQAKSAAARASIHILIPEMREHLDATEPDADFSFFDYVGIEDPRIPEFCAAACEPSPHAILRTCLLRNFGAGDPHIHTEMKKLEHQKIELTMKVGKHSATVVCKNKKSAKQRAAQTILQALHPHVQSWGSLLRLYGSRSVKSSKERKQEEQQITLLQDQARRNEPNHAVLEKLRLDMLKLRARDSALAPVGTLLLPPPPAPAPPLAVLL